MYLKELSLHNVRNFQRVEQLAFSPSGLSIARAPNATGKTNFLESIVVLLRARSWRASLAECVAWGAPGLGIVGVLETKAGPSQIEVTYEVATRTLAIEQEGVPVSAVTFLSTYPVVVFLPEDTFLFSHGPEQRRTFLNHILVSMPQYLAALVQYQRVLRQRNAALKQAQSPSDVTAWNSLLSTYATVLWGHRHSLALFLQTHLSSWYEKLSGEAREFEVTLHTPLKTSEELLALLEQSFASEKRLGYTTVGPHRDDLVVTTQGRAVETVLSGGQLRGVVLAVKMAAAQFLRQCLDEEPLLLLDDVFSELDEQRQVALLTHLPRQAQVVVTCTQLPGAVGEYANTTLLDLETILMPHTHVVPVHAHV